MAQFLLIQVGQRAASQQKTQQAGIMAWGSRIGLIFGMSCLQHPGICSSTPSQWHSITLLTENSTGFLSRWRWRHWKLLPNEKGWRLSVQIWQTVTKTKCRHR